MKARQRIDEPALPPEVLQAFREAWAELAPEVNDSADAIEAARSTLAKVVLSVAKNRKLSRDAIRVAAVNAFRLTSHSA